MNLMKKKHILPALNAIAHALERLSPPPQQKTMFGKGPARHISGFVWHGESKSFVPIAKINSIDLKFLIGIDLQREKLSQNTKAFAQGYRANNALLWGARGMGKSSLIKAIHKDILAKSPDLPLILIEILREDIGTLNECLAQLKLSDSRFILFCDDLSFDQQDNSYKSLKALLEGGLAGRPENVLFYATSNQRHLLSREFSEYETGHAIHGNDVTNETISLSDRFGLWLGFHNCSPQDYDKMIKTYAAHYQIPLGEDELLEQAHLWSMERGARSGRVAWQFTQHLMGQHKIKPPGAVRF